MNETLNLPIDWSVQITDGSYKNPGRLRLASLKSLSGWTVYFGINGKSWPIATFKASVYDGKAIVYGGPAWSRIPWNGQGAEPVGGPNVPLARASGGLYDYEDVRAADRYAIWASNGTVRSPAWWTDNDIYDTKRDSGHGTPLKTRRSNLNGNGMDRPPGYEEEEPPIEPPDEKPPDNLNGVTVADNAAQDIEDWPVTSSVLRVRINDSDICIDHTKLGVWEARQYNSAHPTKTFEANPWVVATIDGQRYGGTWEWTGPNQLCKGMTAYEIGPHVEGHSPLESWVPVPGEYVQFFMSTPCRNDEVPPTKERSNVVTVQWPKRGESIDVKFDEEPPIEPPEDRYEEGYKDGWNQAIEEVETQLESMKR